MKKRFINVLFLILFAIVTFVSIVVSRLASWYSDEFGEKLAMLLFTVRQSEGANMDIVWEAFMYCLPAVIVWGIVVIAVIVIFVFAGDRVWLYSAVGFCAVLSLVAAYLYSDSKLHITDYIQSQFVETDIYENYFVSADVSRLHTESPKNLIYIYMESMETAFASTEAGGRQPDVNYIPNLTRLASDNISFSDNDRLGGFYQVNGTGWTAAATFASMTGVPYLVPTTDISSGYMALTAIGDILSANGYYLEYICGSDADFSGRRTFIDKHGDYTIMDYYGAVEKGYVDEDYYVWWGYEDRLLYDIAKSEITEAASELGQPFDITILTVDTHYTDGYVCDLCDDEYELQFANVIKCADDQIGEFIEWCMLQDWYDDTVIIIQGDHPYMKKTPLLDGIPADERTTYNCFINTGYDIDNVNCTDRVFTCMDMYPTTLAAIGFDLPGHRLALGTDLFSDIPTLAEEIGLKKLDEEFNKHSDWYLENVAMNPGY